jgi:rare lipoprotein A
MHPVDRRDSPQHTATSASALTLQKSHHRSYLNVPRNLLSGIGSWYGDMFNGQATASGEIFNKDALTACHPTLPFGTLVRVINLRNRRSVVVRINDRGIRPDRIIDLSSAAAEKIGLLETGVAPVRIVVLPNERS